MTDYLKRQDGMYDKPLRTNRMRAAGALTGLAVALYVGPIFADAAFGEGEATLALTERGYSNIEPTGVDYRLPMGDLALKGCAVTDVVRRNFVVTSQKGKAGLSVETCAGLLNFNNPTVVPQKPRK